MAGYDVEVIFIIFPFPRRPFFDADFSSTACIANIVAPVSVSPQGAEQSTVKYPLISVPVGLQDAARKCRPHPPTGRISTSFINTWKISMVSMVCQWNNGHLNMGQR